MVFCCDVRCCCLKCFFVVVGSDYYLFVVVVGCGVEVLGYIVVCVVVGVFMFCFEVGGVIGEVIVIWYCCFFRKCW